MVLRTALLTCMVAGVVGCGFDTAAPTDALPKVYFAVGESLTDESIGNQQIFLKLSMKTADVVTVGYSMTGGSATAGQDVNNTSGEVTFAPFQDTAMLSLSIVDDGMEEGEEDVQLTLKQPKNAELGDVVKHTLYISANKLPRVRFVSDKSSANENTGVQNFAVGLDRVSPVKVEVLYTVSGTADPDDHGLVDGLVTIEANEASGALLAAITNDMVDEYDQTIEVSLIAKSGAVIAPGMGQHSHTIVDEDPPPAIAFAASASTVSETAGTVMLDVSLPIRSEKEIKIDYAVAAGGSAAANDDFMVTAGTLTIPPGTTTVQVPVTVVNDTLDENDETVVIALSNPVNATLGAKTQYTLTITDDDNPPAVEFQQDTSTAAEGTATHAVTLTLSTASGLDVKVSVSQTGGTATAADLTVPSTQITIPAGSLSTSFNVTIIDDTADDDNETAVLTLASPVNASLGGRTQHTITITDNDNAPTVRFDPTTPDQSAAEKNSGTTTYTYRVILSASSNNTITVPVTLGGSAMNNDYSIGTNDIPVKFNPGETSKDVRVIVSGDNSRESDETVTLTLGTPTNATNAGDNQVRTHTIVNDD